MAAVLHFSDPLMSDAKTMAANIVFWAPERESGDDGGWARTLNISREVEVSSENEGVRNTLVNGIRGQNLPEGVGGD